VRSPATPISLEITMRTLLLAATALAVAVPTGLSAQQSPAAEVQGKARAALPTTAVTPNPGAPATVTHNPNGTTTVSANPGGPAVVTHNNPGNVTPPPESAMNKTYPVCTRRLQDNCQNPGEGGAPGKSRALGYWPGEPASERRERGG
jgi:hypothetical protein